MKTKFNGILTLLLAFVVQISFAQEKTITGTVVDETNMPLPGATVLIKGTTTGASTDFDGKYSISANVGDVLTFSYVGYADQSSTIGASNKIDITLELDSSLEEIVIEAYTGVTTKAKSTTAATTISAETVENRANASVVQSLQGQVSGLNIGTGSGQPGSNSTILLRGVSSINGNVEPLFIVDGVPVDEDNFRSINTSDVESISVLKDAAATALYGNRGASGVIVMTTKKGKFGQALEISYKGQLGVSVLPKTNFEVMNAYQKLNFNRDNDSGLGSGLSDAEINAIAKQTNTDWKDIFFRRGLTQNHTINISSGTENTRSFTSIGFMNQDGVTRRSALKRFNFRNNFSGKSKNDKFNVNTTLTANYSTSDFIQNEGAGSLANPFLVPYVANPFESPFNPDGSLDTVGTGQDGFDNTPFTSLNNTLLNTDKEEELKIIGSLNTSYKLTKNITAGYNLGVDYTQINALVIRDPRSVYGQTDVGSGEAQFQGSQFESYRRDVRFSNLVTLGYNKVINEVHTFDLNLFTEYNHSFVNSNSLQAFGLNPKLLGYGSGFVDGTTTDDLNGDGVVDGAAEFQTYVPSIGSNKLNVSNFAYFGVLKYDYNEKYGFQATLRRDASSRFKEENKWGTFYSLSGRWNIAKENFMSNSSLNTLKLRVSYGTTGNERISGAYYGAINDFLDLYSSGTGYNNSVSIESSQLGNPDLKWETTAQANIGLDFGWKQNKISGSLDVYDKVTSDLFINSPQSVAATGFTAVNANVGEMSNKGIELTLRYNAIKTDDFNLSIFANGSYNKNEILDLGGDREIIDGGGRTVLQVGQPIGSFYAVKWAGVNPANGNNLYYDIDGNVTENYSLEDRVFIDKAQYPTYQGGFGFESSYKGFSLDTQFSFVADIYRNNGSLGVIEDPTLLSNSNGSVTLLDAWQQPGDITNIPSLNTASIRNRLTDRYIEDASFLRLRNVTLGYNFDSVMNDKWAISGLKVYLQAENLVTWSKWRGWDPESDYRNSDFFDYPTPQIFTLGVDVKF
jgi:TonB-linked SusC/RagA family outer membrane protein